MLKRIILPLIAVLWMIPGVLAQNLELSTEEEGVLEDGQVITVTGDPEANLISAHVNVTNTGNDSINVKVRKVENNIAGDAVNFFCWGSCYLPQVDTSSRFITIHADETNSEFSGDYQPYGTIGISSITYYFYNTENPEEEISVEIHYITQSQSTIQLSTEDEGTLDNEQIITVEGTVDSSLLVSHITVTNSGNDTIDVLARRVENSLVEETVNYFCWGGLCYSNVVDTSTVALTLNPGESADEFEGDYEPYGHSGTTSVSYYFYEKGNPSNQAGVEVHYEVETSGIGDQDLISGLKLYPVPADQYITLEYSDMRAEQAIVRLTNLTGSTVSEKAINPNQNKMQINSSGLDNGIYFISIYLDNRAVTTRKIVVSH